MPAGTRIDNDIPGGRAAPTLARLSPNRFSFFPLWLFTFPNIDVSLGNAAITPAHSPLIVFPDTSHKEFRYAHAI